MRLLKSQIEYLLQHRVQFMHDAVDDVLTASEETVKQISEHEFILTDGTLSLTPNFLWQRDADIWQPLGQAPIPVYLTKEEAHFMRDSYYHLIGKQELVTQATIVELKPCPVSEMVHLVDVGEPKGSDWALFALVRVDVGIDVTQSSLQFWTIFHNTSDYNGGVPTLESTYFLDKGSIEWRDELEWYNESRSYNNLHWAYRCYHSLPETVFADGAYNVKKIVYDQRSGWESDGQALPKNLCYQLYVDDFSLFPDSDGEMMYIHQRIKLFDYVQDYSDPCAEEIRKSIGLTKG